MDPDLRKRKRTQNVKYFDKMRTDLYESHHEGNHSERWTQYKMLSTQKKGKYFAKDAPFYKQISLKDSIANATTISKHRISAEIVDNVLDDMLLDSSMNREALRYNTLACFQKECEGFYFFEVERPALFEMVVNCVAEGLSFRQTARVLQHAKDRLVAVKMGTIHESIVAKYVRGSCAINLEQIRVILTTRVPLFAVALDSSNNNGRSYLDVRLRFHLNADLHNFHLLATPMNNAHAGLHMFDLCVRSLDAVCPQWRIILVGVSTDGAASMTGNAQGLASCIQQESVGKLYRVWCGLHQMDLVMKKAFKQSLDGDYSKILTTLIGHLRRQQTLIAEMKATCPYLAPTRWLSLGYSTQWLVKRFLNVTAHLQERKNLQQAPPLC